MKNLILLLLLVVLSSPSLWAAKKQPEAVAELCAALTHNTSAPDLPALTANWIGSRLDIESLKARLARYTGAAPLGDGSLLEERGSKEGREKTRLEIEAELKFFGYEAKREEFKQGANIVASIAGSESPDEILEITAHYDSVGNPGADDNGSGLALVMELARMLQLYPPKRTVRFVFMDLEEVGFQGSLHHAELLARAKENLVGVLVLDTIAWAPEDTEQQLVVLEAGTEGMSRTSPEYLARVRFAQNLLYPLGRINRDGKLRISVETSGAAPRTADHGSYWRYGIPAVLIGEAFEDGLITPFYHSREDRVENVNWDFYQEVSQAVLEMVAYVSGAQLAAEDEAFVREASFQFENMRFDGSMAWPPAPLLRGPFLTGEQWDGRKDHRPDPAHVKAAQVLDRAFILGDLGDSAAIVVTRTQPNRVWLVGREGGVIDLSALHAGAQAEVAAEVGAFGGGIWAVGETPTAKEIKRLRRLLVNGEEAPAGVQERVDLPANYYNPDSFFGVQWVKRKTTYEKLKKVLNAGERDSVLVFARRRAESEEFLAGLLLVREFDRIQATYVELSWAEVRKLKEELAPRADGLDPLLLFTGADFEEEWQDLVIPNLWTQEARAKLAQDGVRFSSEF